MIFFYFLYIFIPCFKPFILLLRSLKASDYMVKFEMLGFFNRPFIIVWQNSFSKSYKLKESNMNKPCRVSGLPPDLEGNLSTKHAVIFPVDNLPFSSYATLLVTMATETGKND